MRSSLLIIKHGRDCHFQMNGFAAPPTGDNAGSKNAPATNVEVRLVASGRVFGHKAISQVAANGI